MHPIQRSTPVEAALAASRQRPQHPHPSQTARHRALKLDSIPIVPRPPQTPAASFKRPNRKCPGLPIFLIPHILRRGTHDWILTFIGSNQHMCRYRAAIQRLRHRHGGLFVVDLRPPKASINPVDRICCAGASARGWCSGCIRRKSGASDVGSPIRGTFDAYGGNILGGFGLDWRDTIRRSWKFRWDLKNHHTISW